MKPQYCWENLLNACEQSLKSLGDKVLSVHPEVCFRMGRWNNEAFPARFWGSFIAASCDKSIDFSIDLKWGNRVIEVTADVSYDTGEILSEMPSQSISLQDKNIIIEDEVTTLINILVNYVNEQWRLIDLCFRTHK